MKLSALGDQAVLAYLADEPAAVAFASAVRGADPRWLFDVVPAYASVGVFFDAERITLSEVMAWLVRIHAEPTPPAPLPEWKGGNSGRASLTSAEVEEAKQPFSPFPSGRGAGGVGSSLSARKAGTFTIPVCYEMQLDLARVCETTGLSADEAIRLHAATAYTVYAIGFVAGFPYLGYLPPELCGVGRLPSPRLRIEERSVGVAGRQTGIYPLARPGGWNLIGRTPLTVVDVTDGFFPLRVGDKVRFERIDERRYRELEGERLSPVAGTDPP